MLRVKGSCPGAGLGDLEWMLGEEIQSAVCYCMRGSPFVSSRLTAVFILTIRPPGNVSFPVSLCKNIKLAMIMYKSHVWTSSRVLAFDF